MKSPRPKPQESRLSGTFDLNGATLPRSDYFDDLFQPEVARPEIPILSFISQFGLSIGELSRDQLLMFLAGKNLFPVVEKIRIPAVRSIATSAGRDPRGAEKPSSGAAPLRVFSLLPDDDLQYWRLSQIEELPFVVTQDLALRRTHPTEFLRRLAEGELTVKRYLSQPPPKSCESEQRRPVQHYYILLDVTRSMNFRDQRGILARGFALAFAMSGAEREARLHLRPFQKKLGEQVVSNGRRDLPRFGRRIVSYENHGSTNIESALVQAVGDITAEGPYDRADLILLTDGLSLLDRKNLLGNIRLHTILLGDVLESVDWKERSRAEMWLETLREWSSRGSYLPFEIDTIRRMLEVSPADIRSLGEEAHRLLFTTDQGRTCAQAATNMRALLDRYNLTAEERLPDVEERVRALQERFGPAQDTGIATLALPDQRGRGRAVPVASVGPEKEEDEPYHGAGSPEDLTVTKRSIGGGTVFAIELLRLLWRKCVRSIRSMFLD